MIAELDAVLDLFESPEFYTAVDQRSRDLNLSLSHVVEATRQHGYWESAKTLLLEEKSLSPVLLDRMKRYSFIVPPPNVEHRHDVEALAILLLLDDVFGREAAEFRAALTITKNLKNPWWSWQWILGLGIKL
jgi:hypothetical protein